MLDMEKPKFIINGGIKLPIGYRFHPTDEELVVHYLKRKVFSIPLPASVIPEFDVFQTDPWGLPGDLKEKRYFFSNRKRNINENNCKRAAGSGYWKPIIGKDKQILGSGSSNQAVGTRKTLIFCQGKRSCGSSKTRWVMHEYRLVGSEITRYSTQLSKMEMEDWVVYRILEKKRRPKKIISQPSNSKKTQRLEVINPSLMVEDSCELVPPPQPSSSSESEIIQVSNGLDQEETSSYIRFSSFSCI